MNKQAAQIQGLVAYIPDDASRRSENGIRVRPTVAQEAMFKAIAMYFGKEPAVLGRMVIERFIDGVMKGEITRADFLFGRD